jgi:hypothetical protein
LSKKRGNGEGATAFAQGAGALPAGRDEDHGSGASHFERPGGWQEGGQGLDLEEAGGGFGCGAQGIDEGGVKQVSSLNEHRKGKAVLYARVSSDEQVRHGYSLDQQIVALREWTTSENYVVLEEIRDEGWSGAKKG